MTVATTASPLSSPRALQAERDQRHQLVAVDQLALLVDDDQPVGVAVEREADVGAARDHRFLEQLRMGRAAVVVDVEAVGRDAERDHLGAQLPQRLGRDVVGGAVGAIDHDLEPVEPQMLGEGGLGEVDVAAARVVDPPGAADHLRLGELRALLEPLLDRLLVLVAELVAVGAEQLDAVVGERIVRGGDHHAEVGAHRPGQHRHRRGRHRAEQHDVHADAGEAGDHRRFHHVAGQARVLADHHAVAVIAAQEVRAGRLADAQRGLGRHRLAVGGARGSRRCRRICVSLHAL